MLEFPDDLSINPLVSLVDDWVLYHGTSESYSASIESIGLGHHGGTPPYWADVQSFISNWQDFPPSHAFANLAAFSRDAEGIRPVSFAVTFLPAARHAVHQAGGETLRLLRDSAAQISEEMEDLEQVKRRLQEERARLSRRAAQGGFGSEAAFDAAHHGMRGFSSIDRALHILAEPERPLAELREYRARYGSPPEGHAPVVYAVRLQEMDVSGLRTGNGGGGFEVTYRGVLPPTRLVGRVRIADKERVANHPQPEPGSEEANSFSRAVRLWQERLAQ